MPSPLSETEIARELAEYNVVLAPPALDKLSLYLDLLLHWNRKVNLTGFKDPRTIVRRLFAESLYATNVLDLKGCLVDVGSGAGFPGLALKLAAPDLRITLIEARQKKCAFLKEVARECRFVGVEVVAERFQSWAASQPEERRIDLVTTRAVTISPELLQTAQNLLGPGSRLVLFTSRSVAARLPQVHGLLWLPFEAYPVDPSTGLQIGIS